MKKFLSQHDSKNIAIFAMISCLVIAVISVFSLEYMDRETVPAATRPMQVSLSDSHSTAESTTSPQSTAPSGTTASPQAQPTAQKGALGSLQAALVRMDSAAHAARLAFSGAKGPGKRMECDGWLIIVADKSNVRTDAGAEFDLLATVRTGEKYQVTAQKDSSTGVRWFEIKIGEKIGYISGSYVEYNGKLQNAKAYLTFDDGPSENTLKIMDILDRYGVKATFFVIYHKGADDIYRQIVERGHTIALHSYTHDYSYIYKNEASYFEDLEKLSDHVYGLTGVRTKVIRFPGGTSNAVSAQHNKGIMTRLTAEVEKRGYRYFDWNVDSGDAAGNKIPKETLISNIKQNIGTKGNVVILMHDTAVKTTTVEALPEIIEFLQSKGYELLRITTETKPMHHKPTN